MTGLINFDEKLDTDCFEIIGAFGFLNEVYFPYSNTDLIFLSIIFSSGLFFYL